MPINIFFSPFPFPFHLSYLPFLFPFPILYCHCQFQFSFPLPHFHSHFLFTFPISHSCCHFQKRQVKVNFKKDAFISDVCHRCLCVISDQNEMAKGKEYLYVRYLSNGISMFVKYYLISRKPPLRLLLLHFLKKKEPK